MEAAHLLVHAAEESRIEAPIHQVQRTLFVVRGGPFVEQVEPAGAGDLPVVVEGVVPFLRLRVEPFAEVPACMRVNACYGEMESEMEIGFDEWALLLRPTPPHAPVQQEIG